MLTQLVIPVLTAIFGCQRAAPGRGRADAPRRAREGHPRLVPRQRHGGPGGVREAHPRPPRLRDLLLVGRVGRLDGAELLRRHVLHADAP